MPTPSASIPAAGPLLWLAGLFVLGFGIAWLLTDLGGVRRAVYIFFLAGAAVAFTTGYLSWSGTGYGDFLFSNWGWGLIAAAISGSVLAFVVVRQAVEVPRHGLELAGAIAWEGIVYGATEGLLLSVMPVLLVWQSGWLAGWRDSGLIVASVLGVITSLAFIGVHHLGYRGFRGPQVLIVMAGCGLLSVAYVLTGSPFAAVVGHIVMHLGIVIHGTEMPPYAEEHEAAISF